MRPQLLVVLLVAGCGYRFTAPNASLPGGVRSVRVVMLANRTAEPVIEAWLTQALREQLARSGLAGGAAAEATLEGAVLAVSQAPFLVGAVRQVPTYRLSVAVQLTLRRDGVTLAEVTVSESEDFPSGPDAVLTEAGRAAALRRLVELIARNASERLANQW